MHDDWIKRIAETAARRHGHVRLAHLKAAGANADWISRNSRSGWLEHVDRGEYRVGPPTLAGHRRAALDVGGGGSMLLGPHGLDAWGMPTVGMDMSVIDIWVPKQRRTRSGIHFQRSGWITTGDARSRDGLELARRAVCVASVAAQLEPVDLVKLIREACFWERAAFDQLRALVRAHARFPGRTSLINAMRWYCAGHCGLDSRSEKFVLSELRRLGVPMPIMNAELVLRDGNLRPDFYWDAAWLVLENNPVGHQRDWVRSADLGRIARLERDRLDVFSLDRTQPIAAQRRVLLAVAARAAEIRGAPAVSHTIRPTDIL